MNVPLSHVCLCACWYPASQFTGSNPLLVLAVKSEGDLFSAVREKHARCVRR